MDFKVFITKVQFPLLYELAIDPNITVNKVIGYNRFYLVFRRQLTGILKDQLNVLLLIISLVSLTT